MDPAAITQSSRTEVEAIIDRLTADLADAIEQQTVTSEVLQAIGRSASEVQPVFETVVRHAVRLCAADAGTIYQLEGDVYPVAVAVGGSAEYRRYIQEHPVPRGAGTLVGRVELERRTVQITDATTDPQYQWREARKLGGYRTMLGVPMLETDGVVGVIVLWRAHVDPFDERTVGLVTTFAAQGVIAIRNVRLFQELEQRSKQLSSSVDELRALGEVSQAVSSSLDLDEVLKTIVTRAAELSGADGGSIFEFEPSTAEFVLRTCTGTSEALVQTLHQVRIGLAETFIGQAAATGEVRQAPDLDVETARSPRRRAPPPRVAFDGGGPAPAGGRDHRRADRQATRPGRSARRDRPPARDAREPVRGGDPQRARVPSARAEAQRARGGEPAQVRLPRQHVARAADAPERRDRLLGRPPRPDVRGAERAPGRVRPRHPQLGAASARADQRDPRPLEGRGRPDGAGPRRGLDSGADRSRSRDGARARRRPRDLARARHRARGRHRRSPTSSSSSR